MRNRFGVMRGPLTRLVLLMTVEFVAPAQPAEAQPTATEQTQTWQQAMEDEDWPAAQALLEAALAQSENDVESDDDRLSLYENLAAVYRITGDLEAAERVLERLLEEDRSAVTLEELGTVKAGLGEWSEAEKLLRESLTLRRAQEGDSEASIGLLQNLARVLAAQEKLDEAEAAAQAAIDLRIELTGADLAALDPEVAPALAGDYSILARVLQAQEKWTEAAGAWETVIRIQSGAFGKQDLRLAATLDNLASCREELGEVDLAEAALRRALAIRESESGRNSASVAATVDALGSLLFDADRYDDAEAMFRRALNIYLDLLGADNAMIARNYDNLAVTLAKLDRFEESEVMYRAALRLRDIADVESLRNLALILQTIESEDGDPNAEAAAFYARALAVIGPYPYQRPELEQSILAEYLRLLRELGRTAEASRVEQQHLPPAPASKGAGAGSRSK